MNRRQFVLATTAGITALAGCSDSDTEATNEIVETVESSKDDFEQAEREIGNTEGYMNQEQWGSAAGSASDAADAFSDAQNKFRTAISRAEEIENYELQRMLEQYEGASSAGVQACTSLEQACESMIEGDRSAAQSHFNRADQYIEEYDGYELASADELNEAIES